MGVGRPSKVTPPSLPPSTVVAREADHGRQRVRERDEGAADADAALVGAEHVPRREVDQERQRQAERDRVGQGVELHVELRARVQPAGHLFVEEVAERGAEEKIDRAWIIPLRRRQHREKPNPMLASVNALGTQCLALTPASFVESVPNVNPDGPRRSRTL